jgi:PAS domain S-box-containing protein
MHPHAHAQANAPIFGIDTGGLVNEWNEKAAQITGYTKQEVLGKHLVANFVAKDSKDTVQAPDAIPRARAPTQAHACTSARVHAHRPC